MALSLSAYHSAQAAQALYKYKGADGEWMYTDRPPPDQREVEVREIEEAEAQPTVNVFHRLVGRQIRLFARNDFYAPVELDLEIDELRNISLPPPEQIFQFVLAPKSETLLLTLEAMELAVAPYVAYHYRYLPGDPESVHEPSELYRAPFSVANSHVISQAFPYATTHMTPDAYYALDIAMPVGTQIYAARGGIVFEVASTNYRGGLDPDKDMEAANLVRIAHDDGTYAVYAHLNWNTIRVEPGDVVERGEYIADSGNTGFSTGPHLHFALQRNTGFEIRSLPVAFKGANSSGVEPTTGKTLTAYH